MGDDPFIPVGNSAAHGSSNAVNYFINNLGKPSFTIMVVAIGLALGLSVGAVIVMAVGNAHSREQLAATQTLYESQISAMSVRVSNAERETRMLEYYVMELDGKAMQHGIIRTEESWSATKEKRK
jgi:hypothetical protein